MSSDRRVGIRVPVELFLSTFVRDRPYRALAENLSETGVFLSRAGGPPAALQDRDRVIALELELPGTGDTIWARGEVCYRRRGDFVLSDGVRFTGMARHHARLLRDYCLETRRRTLARLLDRIRAPRPAVA